MSRLCLALGAPFLVLIGLPVFAVPLPLEARLEGDSVHILVDGALFTTYKTGAEQKYPYFYPVMGPSSGAPVSTETSEPYPHHHSLFFGCDRVNGGNYWQESNAQGQIRSQELALGVERTGERVSFTNTCVWQRPGEEPILSDKRHFAFSAPSPGIRIIDAAFELTPLVEVTIEKTNHSLFAVRMVPELSVERGGALINAAGQRGEKDTFGQASPWMDYAGTRDGVGEGLAILQHPGNAGFPEPWFTRDYGFFSPTSMYWLPGGKLVLPQGVPVVWRYRVIVHAGSAEAAGIGALFEDYARHAAKAP
ncbi:MAG: PmoA family protein [Candidatus Hydrogenedentes bacterium]|nr:PmoA family protein [Candidatus Hydrogenedentota bacterium]